MGMPEFPDFGEPAPLEDILDRLLESIALEELALAHLVNAEAEKIQAVTAAGMVGPVTAEDITAINNAVGAVIEQVMNKEEQLQLKLEAILSLLLP